MATSSPSKKAATSLIRNVLQSITVGRDGKPVVPLIGQPFEFTAEEIEQIERANPGAISTVVTMDVSDPAVVSAVQGTSGEGSL